MIQSAVFSDDEIRSALGSLSAECARDDWARIGMALKSEMGDAGFALFDDWSQGASNYDKRACRSTWKSIKSAGAGGSVTIASLFKQARDAGWQPDKRQLSAAQLRERDALAEKRRQQRLDAEELEKQAAEDWHRAYLDFFRDVLPGLVKSIGPSRYLGGKRVGAHGLLFPAEPFVMVSDEEARSVKAIAGWQDSKVFLDSDKAKDRDRFSIRFIKRGCLFVPLRDMDGVIRNVQIIYASGKKSFPRNAPKTGLFHLIGEPEAGRPLAVAEGYATAASIHEATGWSCAVALDVNNIGPVARKMQARYPDSPLMLCGDDDVGTPGNPGRKITTRLAGELGCRAVFPDFGAMQ